MSRPDIVKRTIKNLTKKLNENLIRSLEVNFKHILLQIQNIIHNNCTLGNLMFSVIFLLFILSDFAKRFQKIMSPANKLRQMVGNLYLNVISI